MIGVQMVVASTPPFGGGSERQCALLARALERRGDRVSIVARRATSSATAEGVAVHRIASPPAPRAVGALVFSARALLSLLRRRRDYEVVHCHGFEALALVGLAAKWLAGKRLVVKVVTSGRYGDATRLAHFPGGRWIARELARSDAILVLNEESRDEMIRLGAPAERITLVPNGVEIPPRVAPERSDAFVFCGRLVAQKNVEGLLRAWARTTARATARLDVIGDGPLRPELENLAQRLGIADGVRFRGHIEDARREVATAQALVLFSHSEGLSNSLLEAMAAATPVIASDIPGNADAVRDGETGLLVPPGDEDALAGAIDRLASDRALALRIGTAARDAVRRRYDIAMVAEEVHGLYERVLRG